MPTRINQLGSLGIGDYFESCSFHPCLVSSIDSTGVQVEGISLVNGNVHYCNVRHCGLRALSVEEAIRWKLTGPEDVELPLEERWW
jgi:hypothetical protein